MILKRFQTGRKLPIQVLLPPGRCHPLLLNLTGILKFLPHLLYIDRFFHIADGRNRNGRLQVLLIRISAHKQNTAFRIQLTDTKSHLNPVHLRHPDIGNDDVRFKVPRLFQAIDSISGRHDLRNTKTVPVYPGYQPLPCILFIIHKKKFHPPTSVYVMHSPVLQHIPVLLHFPVFYLP